MKKSVLARLGLLSFVCCMALVSELLPTSFLKEMAADFKVPLSQMSLLIGIYAVMSVLAGIPVTRAFSWVNRRTYLIVVCLGFAISNLLIACSPTFTVAFIGRLLAGFTAGAMWAMIASYPIGFLPLQISGRGVAIVLSGVTIGVSVALPLVTSIIQWIGWRFGFLLVGGIFLLLAIIGRIGFVSVQGESYNAHNNYGLVLKKAGVRWCAFLTFLMVSAHYASYIFVQLIADRVSLSVSLAQAIFGIGALVSIAVIVPLIDRYLWRLALGMVALLIAALSIFIWMSKGCYWGYLGFALWGAAFSPMTSILQTATTSQVDQGKPLANSINATSYDLAIMVASVLGGGALARTGLVGALRLSLLCLGFAFLIIWIKKSYFMKNRVDV